MPDYSVGGLFATVGMNTAPFDRALPRVLREFSQLAERAAMLAESTGTVDEGFVAVSASANKASTSVSRNAKVTGDSAAAATKAAASAERQAAAQRQVVAVNAEVAGASAKVQQNTLRQVAADQRLIATSAQLGSAERAQAAETAKLASAQAGAIGAADRLARSQETAGARIVASGKKVSKGITLPVVAAAAVSVDQAVKFQKSMTLIQTAGGETAAKTAVISDGIKKLAVETGTSLDQLGEGIYTIAKAGAQKWSATDQLLVLKAAAEGAAAEQVDLGTATDALSTIMLDYHASASKAVSVENELIRASGLSKTNFSAFSSSLSNVTPIAAALGISFDQVGGAIATMTQHGVSASQATENLRNLLFNLAGQNNVASQAMQQLGINTVSLAAGLSKPGGLANALRTVDAALKAHTKDGLVTIDVQKAAALATHSLSTMMGTFNGKLKEQSAGLLSGKVGIKDYTSYAKSLGGQAGASALQFIALYKNSLGFSNQLKSGKGTITTTTAQYAKLLGGMTGASVAMQIGGKYAADYARNVAEIGKASLEAGSDVLGWNKTQGTLSQKMKEAKASLEVLSVEIGTALIPAVSKIVGVVGDAVHGFEGLSHTQKLVLGWGIGVLAALGPVIAIGSRLAMVGRGITTLTTGIVNQAARFNTGLATNAAGVASAMGKVTAAVGGAAIGVAVGSLTANANTAVKAVGVLSSAAAGAALGFGSGGGAIGAVVGGLAGGLSALATQFFSAGDAARKQIPKIGGLTEALEQDSGAVGRNTEALLANSLQSNGLYAAGLKLGISQRTLTLAAEGNATAMGQVNGAMTGAALAATRAYTSHTNLTKAQEAQSEAAGKLANGLGDMSGQLHAATTAANNVNAGLGKATAGAHGTASAIDKTAASAGLLIQKGTGLDRALTALGKSHPVNVGISVARANIAFIEQQLREMPSYKTITISTVTKGNLQGTYNSQVPHKANGGTIRGPGGPTSDSVLMYGSNGEEVINAKQAAKHRSLLKAINAGVAGFATGGTIGATQSWLRNTVNPQPYVWGAAGPGAWDCSGLVGGVFEHLTGRGHGRLFSTSNEGAVLRSLGFKHGAGGPNALMVAGWNGEHTTGSVGGLKFEAYGSNGVARKDQIRVGSNARDPKSFPNVMYLPNGSDGVKAGATKPGGDPKTGGAPAAAAVSTAKAAAGLFGSAGGGKGAGSFGSQLLSGVSTSGGSVGTSSQSVAASRAAVLANATGAVNSAITSGIAPDPSKADLIGSTTKPGLLANAIGSAYDQQKQADIAGKNYATLAAKVTALRASIKSLSSASADRVNKLRDEADADTKQARALATQASKMASHTKAQRAAKKAVEEHARALRDDAANLRTQATEAARNAAAGTKSLRATLTAQLTAAQTLAAKAKDTYGTISQAAKDAVAKAADYAKTLVADIQSDADTLTSTIGDFKSSMQQGILGDNSISSLWQTLMGATDANGNPIAPTLTALQTNLNTILTSTQGFADDLTSLVGEGAGQDLIAQITSLGTTSGDALAKQLLAAGPAAIAALQTTMASIQSVAGTEANQLATSFYGPGATAMLQFISGLESQFPSLTAALQAIANAVAAAAGVAPIAITAPKAPTAVKTPAPKPTGVTHPIAVKKYALGTNFHPGGLAIVNDGGPELLNLPRGSQVAPSGPSMNFLKHPQVDMTPVVREIQSLRSDFGSLAGAIADVSDERTLRKIEALGQGIIRQGGRNAVTGFGRRA